MSFTWPWALLALLAVPLVPPRRVVVAAPTSAGRGTRDLCCLVRAALPRRTRWRRHVPATLLLPGLVVLSVGAARRNGREACRRTRRRSCWRSTSRARCARPTCPQPHHRRREGRRRFHQGPAQGGSRIGLVAFAGVAGLLVPPTDGHRQAARRPEDPDDVARYGDRAGDPDLARRDRAVRPLGRADRRDHRGHLPERRRTPPTPSSC